MGKSLDVDWPRIQAAYLQGVPSCQLAKEHGVSTNTIAKHAFRDGWTKARRDAQSRVSNAFTASAQQVQARSVQWIARMTKVAEDYLDQVEIHARKKPMTVKELDLMTRITESVDTIGRRTLGLDQQAGVAPIVQVNISVGSVAPGSGGLSSVSSIGQSGVTTKDTSKQVIDVEEIPERPRE
jgi:transposase-like protein